MKLHNIEREYLVLLEKILSEGAVKTDRTGVGTRSLFGEQIKHDMSLGFPLLTTKRLFYKGIFHELVWMIRGKTNIKYLVDNGVNIWNDWPLRHYNEKVQTASRDLDEPFEPVDMATFVERIKKEPDFARDWGDLGPVYGRQWRNWWAPKFTTRDVDYKGVRLRDQREYYVDSIDQLQNAINTLKTSPDSRRIIVSAWNPADIDEMSKAGLPPCHMLYQFNTRPLPTHASRQDAPRYRLDLMMTQRSADSFLGVPFNIASYAALLAFVANVVNMVPGELTISFGDVHIYNNHVDQVREQLTREPRPLPNIRLGRDFSDIEDALAAVTAEVFVIEDYDPWPTIKAPIAV